jgi:DMSO/TMAO reductase YedYZ molybdopterin-dependent catalytic subunit
LEPTSRPRIAGLRVLSRRSLLVGAAAAAGLAACDTDAPADKRLDALAGPVDPITPNEDFYVTSCCGTPTVDGAAWALSVRDDTGERATIDLAWLESLITRDREHTLECIGGGPFHLAIGNAVWSGLPLAELLEALGVEVPADAVELIFTSADDYTTALPVADLTLPVWLVWRMNGAPLPPEHGYPARLLVPGRYGMKNPKWIVEMAFSTDPEPYLGFWETRGWSNPAPYKPNALIHDPDRAATVPAGPVRVSGTAFAGSDPVVAVDVRIDGGDWQPAVIDYAPGPDVWTLWHFDWEAEPGEHAVQARCTTASGAQSLGADVSAPLEGYDGSMEIAVEVT